MTGALRALRFFTQVDLLQCDVSTLEQMGDRLCADTVIMNPPFGTRRRGADMDFLRAAFAGQLPW